MSTISSSKGLVRAGGQLDIAHDGALARPRNRKQRTRAEQTEETFRRLILAATDVIGKFGYEGATVARITLQADVAVGTFYTYFESRQDLFDRLLPLVGNDMLAHVSERVRGGTSTLDREERGFRALFDYYQLNPGLYRLLNEAETMAPAAHAAHFKNLVRHYVRSLKEGVRRGEVVGYADHELEALSYMLLSIRSYLMMRYSKTGRGAKQIPEWLVATYMKFVRGALNADAGKPRQLEPSASVGVSRRSSK